MLNQGDEKRLSTLISGITLLLFIFVFKSVMVAIPTAALIGIMMTVAVDTLIGKVYSFSELLKLLKLLFYS